jgi:hypothetical protein
VIANRNPHQRGFDLTHSYTYIASELSPWKRLILAARECRRNGNLEGASALYKRGLTCAKQSGLEKSAELSSFLATEFWANSQPSPAQVFNSRQPNKTFAINASELMQFK